MTIEALIRKRLEEQALQEADEEKDDDEMMDKDDEKKKDDKKDEKDEKDDDKMMDKDDEKKKDDKKDEKDEEDEEDGELDESAASEKLNAGVNGEKAQNKLDDKGDPSGDEQDLGGEKADDSDKSQVDVGKKAINSQKKKAGDPQKDAGGKQDSKDKDTKLPETKLKSIDPKAAMEGVDISDDINALLEGENLDEEYRKKAETIFEAAVVKKAGVFCEKFDKMLREEYNKQLETIKEGIEEKLDSYLSYVVEEWVNDNKVAVENGLKTEITEHFITNLKDLFQEHYIELPEEKCNIVEQLTQDKVNLEKELNKKKNELINLNKKLTENNRKDVISEVGFDLTEDEKEKLSGLAENLELDENFKEKVKMLKENYFSNNSNGELLTEENDFDDTNEEKETEKNALVEEVGKILGRKSIRE